MPLSPSLPLQNNLQLSILFSDALFKSDKYVFHKPLQLLDRIHIHTGETNGSSLGADTSQKAGFHGFAATQPASADQAALATGGTGATAGAFPNAAERDAAVLLINEIRSVLVSHGIFKGSA